MIEQKLEEIRDFFIKNTDPRIAKNTPDILKIALPVIEPLMLDDSEYVQKGIGTLLRGLWKKWPDEIEKFLFKWRDQCGRLIIQYATEKMDKDYRKKFRKRKSSK